MTLDEDPVTVIVGVDHRTLERVAIHAAIRATRYAALEPLRQGGPAAGRGLHGRNLAGVAGAPQSRGSIGVRPFPHGRGAPRGAPILGGHVPRAVAVERHVFRSPAQLRPDFLTAQETA